MTLPVTRNPLKTAQTSELIHQFYGRSGLWKDEADRSGGSFLLVPTCSKILALKAEVAQQSSLWMKKEEFQRLANSIIFHPIPVAPMLLPAIIRSTGIMRDEREGTRWVWSTGSRTYRPAQIGTRTPP